MDEKNEERPALGHGKVKRYKTGSVYVPAGIWDMISKDNMAEYVADMQTMLVFKPDIDPEILMISIELIKKYLEKELRDRGIIIKYPIVIAGEKEK